ncbi:MAG: ribosome-associated translation inhibitor RaiA [Clostridia bacterium]|nr:ribosome-associated translation inhibitor RaiA [Clostridia bacterium]
MKLNIVAKNFEVSNYLKEMVEKKFSKLEKYFEKDVKADVKISVEAGLEKMEATIFAGSTIFRAEEKSTDVYAALDGVTDKLSKQMVKFKDKIVSKHQTGGIIFDEIEENEDENASGEIEIVRTKRFPVKPMDKTEAALQMLLLDHSFFVFRDAVTDDVCVVYKRKDGKIGLIEPYFD